jgi:putative DNA primase/helicase
VTFEDFARLHGVIVGRLIAGKWVRVATEDKPRSRNGAYKFIGDMGFVQNWATMTEAATWRCEGESTAGTKRAQQLARRGAQDAARHAQEAARKAEHILSECELATHPYLAAKGFPDELVNVWHDEKTGIRWMCIPMRRDGRVTGLQRISDQLAHERTVDGKTESVPNFEKKFLFGQRSELAEFVMGQRGTHVLCEGYATALSVRQALQNLKVPFVLHVTFSAGNMKKVAATLPAGLVLADYDLPSRLAPDEGGMGWKVAREIGWPFWTSDTAKEDFNDAHQRLGVFAVSMQLKAALMGAHRRAA